MRLSVVFLQLSLQIVIASFSLIQHLYFSEFIFLYYAAILLFFLFTICTIFILSYI